MLQCDGNMMTLKRSLHSAIIDDKFMYVFGGSSNKSADMNIYSFGVVSTLLCYDDDARYRGNGSCFVISYCRCMRNKPFGENVPPTGTQPQNMVLRI